MLDYILKLFFGEAQPVLPMGHPLNPIGRSGRWPTVRKEHLKNNPRCIVSGLKADLEVHHIKPFHMFPELELEPTNLATLSRPYHFLLGHLCNWSNYNPDFLEMVTEIREKMVQHRTMGTTILTVPFNIDNRM